MSLLLLLLSLSFARSSVGEAAKLLPPLAGVYHAAHPDFGLRDDLVTPERVRAFVELAGKPIVWAYVSFHWDRGIVFPVEACKILHKAGVVPLVGMMPWSTLEQGKPEPLHTLSAILRGDLDDMLRQCARDAKNLGFPIMMEFGPEVNGSWFPWNGAWNGRDGNDYGRPGKPAGPERFRDAYRRIVKIFEEEGAHDITWVFHIAAAGTPHEAWNAASCYYPGDDCIDWIGVSIYGRLVRSGRQDISAKSFSAMMDKVYPGLAALSRSKPIAVLEIGISDNRTAGDKPQWIADAMRTIADGRYPRLRAVSWWNKTYRPDGSRSTLEIDSSPESLAAYRNGVRNFVEVPRWSVE